MRFAHIADCHVGSWRDGKMRELNYASFSYVIEQIVKEKVDFLLVSGDLFNTSFPPIDALKLVISKFKLLKNNDIGVYFIAGSHDFSPNGKTMLDIIEEAGLGTNVTRGKVVDGKLFLDFTVDKKTGAKITGILGKRGMLDRRYYESLDRESLEREEGFKIFMFHTAISELKSKEYGRMESSPISLLPKNFDYYAGGHVHMRAIVDYDGYRNIVYPGPLMPNSFDEFEDLEKGSYMVYYNGEVMLREIDVAGYKSIKIDCEDTSSEEVAKRLETAIEENDLNGRIVTIRLGGLLGSGKMIDIDFNNMIRRCYDKGALFVMKNTSAVKHKEFEEVKIATDSVERIEEDIIDEHLGQMSLENMPKDKEKEFIMKLMDILDAEKHEGENKADFEKRVNDEVEKILEQM